MPTQQNNRRLSPWRAGTRIIASAAVALALAGCKPERELEPTPIPPRPVPEAGQSEREARLLTNPGSGPHLTAQNTSLSA